jgi:hypothetical protein
MFQKLAIFLLAMVGAHPLFAAEFFCSGGDVTCLIVAINEANGLPGEHTIILEPGNYTSRS